MPQKTKLNNKDIVLISLSVTLIIICSWISIPLMVPFTMQTFAVFTIIGLLGTKRSTIAILIYILIGAIGIPVFSEFTGGLGRLLGSTGGYIIGFIFTALISGFIIDKLGKSSIAMIFSMIIGLLTCYLFGTAWFIYIYTNTTDPIGIMTALSWCVFPFIIPDLLKISLAVLIVKRVSKYIQV